MRACTLVIILKRLVHVAHVQFEESGGQPPLFTLLTLQKLL